LANVALVVVQGGLPLASLYVLKRILDAVAASVVGPGRSELVQHVWLWILVAGGLALLTAFARLVYSRRLYGLQREQTEQDRRAWYYHTVLTKVLHAKELRIFNLDALFQARY
jgi:ABC-type multidrug transport system fused ATPase/permease subunit